MAITLTQHKVATGSGDSQSITFGSAPASDSLIVVAVGSWGTAALGAGACTDNKGNTYTRAAFYDRSGDGDVAIYYALAATTGATFTITVNPGGSYGYTTVAIAEFAGAAISDVLDQNHSGGATSTAPSSGNIRTDQDDELYFGVVIWVWGGGKSTCTPSAGWTEIDENETGDTSVGLNTEYKTAAAGTHAATWTLGASVQWSAAIASFRAADTALSVSVSESVTVSDSPTVSTGAAADLAINVSESVTVSESVAAGVGAASDLTVNVSEHVTVSDAATVDTGVLAVLSISVSEQVGVAATPAVGSPYQEGTYQERHTFQLLVNNVDYIGYMLRGSLRIVQAERGEVGTLTAQLIDYGGGLNFATALWQEVYCKTTTGSYLFGGYLIAATPEYAEDETRAVWTLKAESWATLLSRAPIVRKSYVGKSCGYIVQDILTLSGLTGFDTSSYVATGDTLATFNATGEKATELLDRLASLANVSGAADGGAKAPFVWWITPDKTVRFGLASAFAAPFSIVPLASANWSTSFPTLRSGNSVGVEYVHDTGDTGRSTSQGGTTTPPPAQEKPPKWY